MNLPTISIVIPSYQQGQFLDTALSSLFDQNDSALQVIVIDGGSTDTTIDVLLSWANRQSNLKWISEPDDGPADAVNKGLALADGSILGIQSADDYCLPGSLGIARTTFSEHPHCSLVYGDVEGVDIDGHLQYVRRFPSFSLQALFAISCTLAQGSIYFRRDAYKQLGGWNARYYSCDLEYWMRLCLNASAVHIPQPLSAWRIYPGNRTSAHRKIWDGYWRMIKESKELADQPLQVQRWARASAHLLALRFPPDGSRLKQLAHAWLGLALHPTFWRYNPWRRSLSVLPGWKTLRRLVAFARG